MLGVTICVGELDGDVWDGANREPPSDQQECKPWAAASSQVWFWITSTCAIWFVKFSMVKRMADIPMPPRTPITAQCVKLLRRLV